MGELSVPVGSVKVESKLPPYLHEWLVERVTQTGLTTSSYIRMVLLEKRRAESETQ